MNVCSSEHAALSFAQGCKLEIEDIRDMHNAEQA